MSEKPISEWRGGVDAKLTEHGTRIEKLEDKNEERDNAIVKAMWWCIKLLGAVTLMTVITEKGKERLSDLARWLGL